MTGFDGLVKSYDFHIYYNDLFEPSKKEAIELKNSIFDKFQEYIDKDELVIKVLRDPLRRGPHYIAFFEVDIEDPLLFAKFISFIQINHGSLSVLVHPNSGDVLKDHTDYAAWIGDKLPLVTQYLEGAPKGTYPDIRFPSREVINKGFYDDYEQYKNTIMIRLLEVGDREKLWG